MSNNPFDRFKKNYNLQTPAARPGVRGGNQNVFDAGTTATQKQAVNHNTAPKSVKVSFPDHLFLPEGAQSLDFRRVVNLPTGSTDYELFRFQAPPGVVTHFLSYGIFNDGDNGANFNFRPLVDGNRVFPFHGDPSQNFKIYLGLGPDLSNTSMIPCQLTLAPGQILQWLVTNTSGVDTSMGVRMAGYYDASKMRETARFGG